MHPDFDLDLSVSFNQLKIKAQKRAIEDKLTSYYKKLIDNDEYDDFDHNTRLIVPVIKSLKDKTDNIFDVKNGKNPYCFFTINFKPEYEEKDVVDLHKQVDTFFKKQKYVSGGNYIWSLEQRSDVETETTGYHVHVLFEKGEYSPSKISRAFNNYFFDKFVGTPSALDYRYIKDREPKIMYILGFKKDEHKYRKVLIDRRMKARLGLPNYTNQGWDEDIKRLSEEWTQIVT